MGFSVLDCKKCNKSKKSKSRGKFYAQTIRVHDIYTMCLICATCRNQSFYPIVEPKTNKIAMLTGAVYHCCGRVHKIYITSENVIVSCTSCGFKQYFERSK